MRIKRVKKLIIEGVFLKIRKVPLSLIIKRQKPREESLQPLKSLKKQLEH